MPKVNTHPKNADLSLDAKELLKIEIFYSSFMVTYQKITVINVKRTLEICEDVFPLKDLSRFFEINSKLESRFIKRAPCFQWAPNFDDSIWLKPGSQNLRSKIDTEE